MIIDLHFHLLADTDVSGCRMSERIKKSPAGAMVNVILGTTFLRALDVLFPDDDPEPDHLTSRRVRERLLKEIKSSKLLDGVVLLAMDGRWSASGDDLFDQSDLVVGNDYALKVVARARTRIPQKKFYAGASIHPFRPDALDELQRVREAGAVLVKWIPSSQQIALGDPRCRTFARKLAELGMPLLCHAGWEGAIPVDGDSWRAMEDPGLLEPLLDEGATVIVAHCASPYAPNQPDYVPTLLDMMRKAPQKGWKLHADVSALLLSQHRAKSLRGFLQEVGPERLVYGTDFPIPTLDLTFGGYGPAQDMKKYLAAASAGWLDKDILLKQALGFPQEIFQNTAKVLGVG